MVKQDVIGRNSDLGSQYLPAKDLTYVLFSFGKARKAMLEKVSDLIHRLATVHATCRLKLSVARLV